MLFVAVAIAAATFLYKRRLKKRFSRQLGDSVSCSCEQSLLVVDACGAAIDKALKRLGVKNNAGAYKGVRADVSHAVGHHISGVCCNNETSADKAAVYRGYMIEATDKLVETCYRMLTAPDYYMAISERCEIETLREGISRLVKGADRAFRSPDGSGYLSRQVSNEKDFIEYVISTHSRNISSEDFDDGSHRYAYLQVLYYLHSFVSSLKIIVKECDKQCAA